VNAVSDLLLVGRVGASLVVVVVLAVLAARLARKVSVRGPGTGLRVLDRVGVSREAAVAVVQVGDRALVLGVTAREITLLTELSSAELARADADQQTADDLSAEPAAGGRRAAAERTRGTGSVLDPRTWKHGVDALRDLTVRR
jgi:flagellar protein FliO/FliZ